MLIEDPTTRTDWPLVLPDDEGIRPAGPPDACFYCKRKVGEAHGAECVTVTKVVRVRFTVDLDLEEPFSWPNGDVEFYFNESSWCANNLMEILKQYSAHGCLCSAVDAEVLRVVDETPTGHRKGGKQMGVRSHRRSKC